MTVDLVEFLTARLDEDWQAAYEAGDGGHGVWSFNPELPWNGPDGPRDAIVTFQGSAMGFVAAVDPVHGEYGAWAAQHIARHDPARVLDEVDAKRRLVELLKKAPTRHMPEALEVVTAAIALRLLALPYSDHPDYDEAWRP